MSKTINGVKIKQVKYIDGVYFYEFSEGWFFEYGWDYEKEGNYSRTFKTIDDALNSAFED